MGGTKGEDPGAVRGRACWAARGETSRWGCLCALPSSEATEALPAFPFKRENLLVILEECPEGKLLLRCLPGSVSGFGQRPPGSRQPPTNDSVQVWPFLPDTGSSICQLAPELPAGPAMTLSQLQDSLRPAPSS